MIGVIIVEPIEFYPLNMKTSNNCPQIQCDTERIIEGCGCDSQQQTQPNLRPYIHIRDRLSSANKITIVGQFGGKILK